MQGQVRAEVSVAWERHGNGTGGMLRFRLGHVESSWAIGEASIGARFVGGAGGSGARTGTGEGREKDSEG
jgi:hypothetical protein